MLRGLIHGILGKFGYDVISTRGRYASDGLFTLHSDRFREDPAFRRAYARGVRAGWGYDPRFTWRVHVALWAAKAALRVPGDFVECGVNAGFISSAIMEYLDWRNVDKKFYLVDTFTGPVFSQYSEAEVAAGRVEAARNALAAGAYVTDLERVQANFAEWPSAIVVQGTVPDVLPRLPVSSVALLHIDLNCAGPERAALEYFWDRLSPGALVLFDDYTYFGQQCQGDAIDEAARQLGATVLSLPTGQGLIIK